MGSFFCKLRSTFPIERINSEKIETPNNRGLVIGNDAKCLYSERAMGFEPTNVSLEG